MFLGLFFFFICNCISNRKQVSVVKKKKKKAGLAKQGKMRDYIFYFFCVTNERQSGSALWEREWSLRERETTASPAGDRRASCLAKGHQAKSQIRRKKAQENIAEREAHSDKVLPGTFILWFFRPLEKCAADCEEDSESGWKLADSTAGPAFHPPLSRRKQLLVLSQISQFWSYVNAAASQQ